MGGWNIWYALINFAILAAALWFVGRGIVAKMFGDNRRKIEDSLNKAKAAASRSEALNAELERQAADFERQRQAVLDSAMAAAAADRRANEEKIKDINDSIAAAVPAEPALTGELLSRAKQDAVPGILAAAAELMASKDYEARRRALEASFPQEVRALLSLTQADRAALRWNGALRATLTGADESALSHLSQVREAVREVLGQDIDISPVTDPSVIGGLCLQIGDTVYDGTLQGMLSRLSSQIRDDHSVQSDIPGFFRSAVSSADNGLCSYQTGHVLGLSEGICTISGLSDVMAGEMLEIEGGVSAMVMGIEPDTLSAVLMGGEEGIHSGAAVRRTRSVMEVTVGDELIGRVLNGLGKPIDGGAPILSSERRPVESPAPPIIARQSVSVPMKTGILAIDALVPIGRGQRELIIGDRQTGKTSIAVDSIINQKGKDVICIYVAIGQKDSTVAGIVSRLREMGAMDYTIIVNAMASDPAPMLYLAPYVGTAIGEYFMNSGRHVLIVYDDLSKHAVAYRELSLLLQRAPGREAYPGDVFYLHSRLLERSACLNAEHGGGSMTALPIVETQAGDISAYIPTNVISITDGQIFLDGAMFNTGKRPAINAGLSVSRVGGAAQPKAMKQFASRLRVDLAQHRELEAFSQFGSDLDKTSLDALNRGRRVTELLVQKRYSPMTAAQQVVSVFAVNEGYADDVDVEAIPAFRAGVCAYVEANAPEICAAIESGAKLSEDQTNALRAAIEAYKAQG